MQSERSERLRELTPAARRRGLYFIDRCGGVMFPVALVTIAAYKVSLRVQSEQSERLRELPSAGTHRGSRELAPWRVQSERSAGVPPVSIRGVRSTPFRSALIPNIHYSRSLLN